MSRLILIHIAILIFLPFSTSAQKQNAVWYFGENAGLDFSGVSPIALTNGPFINEGSASISDANGRLLFYTDGISVWDANRIKMPNGTSLAGHASSTQSALIVPKPGDCSIYYIFTVPAQDSTLFMSYSIVDMRLNGGTGDVLTKNIKLQKGVTERLTATLHANGSDYWVLAQEFGGNGYYAFAVTSAGISTVPVTSKTGLSRLSINDVIGYMKFSSDGKKLCYTSTYSLPERSEIFDFDNTSGIVSNPVLLNIAGYGVEFSPDNTKLYIATINAPFSIYQYQISGAGGNDISSTKTLIYNTGLSNPQYGGALQLAPDGKIYVNRLQKGFVGAINLPDLSGTGCTYVDSAVFLAGKKCIDGLPNCIKKYGSNCGTVTAIYNPGSLINETAVLYPNPMQNAVNLKIVNPGFQKYTIQVFNALGALVRNIEDVTGTTSGFKINRGNLSSGVYIVKLFLRNKVVTTQKLIIE